MTTYSSCEKNRQEIFLISVVLVSTVLNLGAAWALSRQPVKALMKDITKEGRIHIHGEDYTCTKLARIKNN